MKTSGFCGAVLLTRLERYSPALAAGFVGTIAVVLASLPLRSPHDALLNAGTVAAATTVTTLALAYVCARIEGRSARVRLFMGVCAVATVASLMAALVAQVSAEIERTVSFVTPLAAIQFGTTGLLAPLTSIFKSGLVWIAILLLVVLTSLGAVFAGDGDQRSGRLTLPERSTSVLETSTETMAHIERTSVA